MGGISVAMEHWIAPRVWVRRDPLSQERAAAPQVPAQPPSLAGIVAS